MSSLLFNTVLKYALEGYLERWQEGNKGFRLGARRKDCFTYLRFADDVLLFSTSLSKLKDILQDFKRRIERVGLEIHPNKTKILSNQDTRRQKEVVEDNLKVEVLQKKAKVPSTSGRK